MKTTQTRGFSLDKLLNENNLNVSFLLKPQGSIYIANTVLITDTHETRLYS